VTASWALKAATSATASTPANVGVGLNRPKQRGCDVCTMPSRSSSPHASSSGSRGTAASKPNTSGSWSSSSVTGRKSRVCRWPREPAMSSWTTRSRVGALRGGAVGLQAPKPRLRRLPPTQGARAIAHPGHADHRAQARPPLLPQPARARPRRARTRHLTRSRPRDRFRQAHQVSDDSQSSGRLPQVLRHPPTSGGPKKIERPESIPADRPIDADRPINHHVAGHQGADPDKPGRPRNDHTHRHRGTPQPLAPDLDNGPGSDKQRCGCVLLRVVRFRRLALEDRHARSTARASLFGLGRLSARPDGIKVVSSCRCRRGVRVVADVRRVASRTSDARTARR
jgi:hypothetical protein